MMRKAAALCLLLVFAFAGLLSGQPAWTDLDLGKTLRADYIFSGTDKETGIALAGLHRIEGWAGRRVNMDVLPLRGNGQIVMRMQDGDGEYSRTVYASSFSTLFQEWQATEEATRIRRSFENVFLLPMPARKAEVTVTLFDVHGGISCSFNASLISRAVYNLLQNAYKYGKEGGYVRLSLKRGDGMAVLETEDNGIGISAEDQEKIWQRFWQADASRSEGGSSGLGLAMVKEIASLHGGDVSVKSAPGEGSTFTLRIPLESDI